MESPMKCQCGAEHHIPAYPHANNRYDVSFPTSEVVIVTIKCSECKKLITTSFTLTPIETTVE